MKQVKIDPVSVQANRKRPPTKLNDKQNSLTDLIKGQGHTGLIFTRDTSTRPNTYTIHYE